MKAYPSPSAAELQRLQTSYKRRQRLVFGLALLFLALFLTGMAFDQAGVGGEKFFVFATIGVGVLYAMVGGLVWCCPRCRWSFNRRIIVARCDQCGLPLEPAAEAAQRS
jgi:hypothetical protein